MMDSFRARNADRTRQNGMSLKMNNFFSWVFDRKITPDDANFRDLFAHADYNKYGSFNPSSDSIIVDLGIDTFLGLCEPIPSDDAKRHQRESKWREIVGRKGMFDHIPYLEIKFTEDDNAKVIGHDGRHRAMLMKRLGYKAVPVRLVATNFKWGETPKGNMKWPSWLWCQNDKSADRNQYRFKFPVSKEGSKRNYGYPPTATDR